MNLEEYISSGILESYALGLTSESENALIDCLIKTQPSLAAELKAIQDTLELVAQKQSKTPPLFLKDQIKSQLTFSKEETSELRIERSEEVQNEKEISRPEGKSSTSWFRAAAAIFIIVSLGFTSFYMLQQNKTLLATVKEKTEIQKELNNDNKQKAEYVAFLANQATMRIDLAGVPTKEDMKAVVFWNKSNKHVMVTGLNLPEVPTDKEYQLWAIVDGKPVDAGMIDLSNDGLLEMKHIDNSQAFAITMEPKGGSESPHLEDLCVIGNVK